MGLIFRSALPEELEEEYRAEDVALSPDAIRRCLVNMLTALDRDTPQTSHILATYNIEIQETTTIQEPPWLWFTLPELGFPLLTDEYHRPIHPDIEDYMRRYISNDQDWEQVDDEDCWGVNYIGPTARIKEKIEATLHSWGGAITEPIQGASTKPTPERERFSVPHASRDPKILQEVNLENEDIFELIKNPPEMGAVRIFEQPESWDSTKGSTIATTTQGIATILLPSGPLNMDGAQWHLLKHTLTNNGSNPIGSSLQTELTRQLLLDKDKKHRSFSWKLLRIVKNVFHATKYQGDTAITIPPFFQNAGRGTERIWGETLPSPQPLVINWPGLNDKEKIELIPILASTENWILLTYPLGAKNKSQPPLVESQRIARAEGKCSRHKGWWREGKDELASHSTTTEVWISIRSRIPETTRITLQESLEEDNRKHTPAFGDEDPEIIHRSGTEAGLLGIYNFPGAVYATDGSNDRGVMGAGFFLLNEHRGGCCQLGRGIEGNSSNRAELGAACLALEDTTNQQDGNL